MRVGVRERVGDLAPGRDHLLRLQPPGGRALEPVGQRAAGHVAGDEARRAVVLEDVVDGDDVAVAAEPRGQPGLAAQALPRPGPAHPRERDAAVEREVVREPHVLGRAAAEPALQEVAAGDHAGRGRRPARRRSGEATCTPRRDRHPRAAGGRSSGTWSAAGLRCPEFTEPRRLTPRGERPHTRRGKSSPRVPMVLTQTIGEGCAMAAPSLLFPPSDVTSIHARLRCRGDS